MYEELIQSIMQALMAIAIAGISALTAVAISYLQKLQKKATSETEKIDNESTQAFIDAILDTTFDLMFTCVDKIEVTVVKTLKEASADGKLTKEDQATAAHAAMELFQSLANDEILKSLNTIVGDTETYLLTLIDSIVLNKKTDLLKNGVNPAVTTKKMNPRDVMLNS